MFERRGNPEKHITSVLTRFSVSLVCAIIVIGIMTEWTRYRIQIVRVKTSSACRTIIGVRRDLLDYLKHDLRKLFTGRICGLT